MELVALVLAAFFQLVSLSLDQLEKTVDTIKTALVAQYVDAAEGQRLAGPGSPVGILKIAPGGRLQGPAMGRAELRPAAPQMKRAGDVNRRP